ncbi:MAG TPA: hypothetical protein VK139_03055 [Microbacteriaceae bacterium]|nr:hypothetical protein [Microbacteriaceae bacterium]
MSIAEVRDSESLTVEIEDDDLLIYSTMLDGHNYRIAYIFVGNRLCRAKYILNEEFVNENNYLSAASSLREALTVKYGKPKDHREYWLNDLWRDDYAMHGRAVASGHYSLYTTWELGETELTLGVSGENFDIRVIAEYSSVTLSELEASLRQSAVLDEL